MAGGDGDDTYVVDSISDAVTESSSEGTDLIQSSVTFTAPSNVEQLTSLAQRHQRHRQLPDNTLTGNSGNNSIDGDTGNDTMAGGDGDDTYVVVHLRRRHRILLWGTDHSILGNLHRPFQR